MACVLCVWAGGKLMRVRKKQKGRVHSTSERKRNGDWENRIYGSKVECSIYLTRLLMVSSVCGMYCPWRALCAFLFVASGKGERRFEIFLWLKLTEAACPKKWVCLLRCGRVLFCECLFPIPGSPPLHHPRSPTKQRKITADRVNSVIKCLWFVGIKFWIVWKYGKNGRMETAKKRI